MQDNHYHRARSSLQQALSWYSNFRRHGQYIPNADLQATVRGDLQLLRNALEKLDRKSIHIAAFGLVSQGKSAILNALLGQKVFETGPLHGVTKYPRSHSWVIHEKLQVELVDTPGLDEIEGQARADLAKEVAYQADLILFIVSGDITRTEYEALCQLRTYHKPLLLVFNKIDLYPDQDRTSIYRQLQQWEQENPDPTLQDLLTPQEVVMVAADPSPIRVRIEHENGTITEDWEYPQPQIYALQEKILEILNLEGRSLLALNALVQAREAETNLAQKTVTFQAEQAEQIIWNYAKYKAVIVALNPIAILDVLGGFFADLALIRSLAQLYGLPMTSYEAGKLWQKILWSAGGVFLSEIGSSVLLGIGKSGMALHTFENPSGIAVYGTTAALQGGVAGYGTYAVGKVAQEYLARGCSWGQLGPSTVIQEILAQVDTQTIISRLRTELGDN